MQFSSVQDVNAPLDFVFQQLSDFDSYEAYGLRTGASVERIDDLDKKGPGMCWHLQMDLRGKRREIDLELLEFRPDNLLKFFIKSSKGL